MMMRRTTRTKTSTRCRIQDEHVHPHSGLFQILPALSRRDGLHYSQRPSQLYTIHCGHVLHTCTPLSQNLPVYHHLQKPTRTPHRNSYSNLHVHTNTPLETQSDTSSITHSYTKAYLRPHQTIRYCYASRIGHNDASSHSAGPTPHANQRPPANPLRKQPAPRYLARSTFF